MFTVITTKDQSGGIYNSYRTGGQRFMAVVNKPRPQALFAAINPGTDMYTAIHPGCAYSTQNDVYILLYYANQL